jgi:hypothetical protein
VTDLRKQFDAAKSDYLAQRYPGKLIDDVMPIRPNRWRLIAYAAPLLAAAAALVIYLGTGHTISHPSHQSLVAVIPTTPPLNVVATPTTTASVDDSSLIPQYIELTPSSETFSVPAIQLVPSWDDVANSSSTSTTQESV